ncbi:MAG: sodium:solute symporter family protein [Gammaproteobacteria bacterium]|nr:sodium:solute symporter family protein [Gammaproteobacteria bacterium]
MNIYAIGIISSIVLYLIIGGYAGRKVKHIDDFFVAGRSAPTLLIVGTLVASFLSTNSFLGETGFTYSGHGPLLFIMTAVNCLGYILGALFFGRYLRRSNVLTVAEFFGRRFDSHRVQLAAGLTIIVGISAYLLAVTQGASLIISEVMEIPYGLTLVIVWLGYTLFTLYSGSRGVVITDTIMFLLFTIIAFVALFFIIDSSGGWFATIKSLAVYQPKPGIISWHGVVGPDARWHTRFDAVSWGVILGVSWGFVVAVSPWQSSRYLMAKDEHTVIRSACFASAAVLVLYLALIAGAAAINLSNPNIEPIERVMIWAALNLMPSLPGVLLMAGITAAALSSASTFLSLIGFSASHDILVHKQLNERTELGITRFTILLIGLVILLIAFYQPPAIFLITYFAGTLFASSWGPVALMSVWSKNITADAAFWGIISGFFGNIVAKLLAVYELVDFPVYFDPFIIGLLLSTLTILVISKMGTVSEKEKQYRADLHLTPVNEIDTKKLQDSQFIVASIISCGVVLLFAASYFYVIPYHEALQEQAGIDSNNFSWKFLARGEFLMVLVYAGGLTASGLLTRYWLKREYSPAKQSANRTN